MRWRRLAPILLLLLLPPVWMLRAERAGNAAGDGAARAGMMGEEAPPRRFAGTPSTLSGSCHDDRGAAGGGAGGGGACRDCRDCWINQG
eukprot:gene12752-39678_t